MTNAINKNGYDLAFAADLFNSLSPEMQEKAYRLAEKLAQKAKEARE